MKFVYMLNNISLEKAKYFSVYNLHSGIINKTYSHKNIDIVQNCI